MRVRDLQTIERKWRGNAGRRRVIGGRVQEWEEGCRVVAGVTVQHGSECLGLMTLSSMPRSVHVSSMPKSMHVMSVSLAISLARSLARALSLSLLLSLSRSFSLFL